MKIPILAGVIHRLECHFSKVNVRGSTPLTRSNQILSPSFFMHEIKVSGIYIASDAGEPMRPVPKAMAYATLGLEGDRYYDKLGFWQNVKNLRAVRRDVSLISEKSIEEANYEFGGDFNALMTRRNLLISGDLELVDLIDQLFMVGDVLMKGEEECTPCNRPSVLSGIKQFEKAFKQNGRGGIRAQVLSDGEIKLGDRLAVVYR